MQSLSLFTLILLSISAAVQAVTQDTVISTTTNSSLSRSDYILTLKNNLNTSNVWTPKHTNAKVLKYSSDSEENNFIQLIINELILPLLHSFCGLMLIVSGTVLLWFNEKKVVEMLRIVTEGEKACLDASLEQYDPELNGELVHVSGKLTTPIELYDPTFGIKVQDTIKLKRVVEVYQIQEREENSGSMFKRKEYKYENTWKEFTILSMKFHDELMRKANEKIKFIAHKITFSADLVNIGSFKLTPYQVHRLENYIPLILPESMVESLPRDIQEKIKNLGWENQIIEVKENCLMIKQSSAEEPQIGDIRVTFYKVPCDDITIISEQAGITFRPYHVKDKRFLKKSESEKSNFLDEEEQMFDRELERGVDGCCWGTFCWFANTKHNPMRLRETIDWIFPGKISKNEFFVSQIKAEKSAITSIIRFFGIPILSIGLYLECAHAMQSSAILKILTSYTIYPELIIFTLFGLVGFSLIHGFAMMFYKRLMGLLVIVSGASGIAACYVLQRLVSIQHEA